MHPQGRLPEVFFRLAACVLWILLSPSSPGEEGPDSAAPFRKWIREAEALLISDLSAAVPADALSVRREKGKWKVISYATPAFEGKSLACGPETGAAEVSVSLPVRGWHAVYVGLANVERGDGKAGDNGVFIRLSGDTIWMRRRNTHALAKRQREVIEEVFVTVADLADRSIQFRQMPFRPGAVMFVRLVPLTPGEVASHQASLSRNACRHMIATIDGHGMLWQNQPRTAEEICIGFDGFDTSDFGKWWFQFGGADMANYPTRAGTVLGSLTEDFVRDSDREFAASVRHLNAAGISTLKVAREAARRNGAEFHVFVRPSSWQAAIPWEENFSSRFYAEHPEWRCIDRDGTPALYLSYAVPEVRRHMVDMMRETVLDCDPDGVGILFHRGVPLILWEPAFVESYRAKYGADPRLIAENDPAIYAERAEILTAFLREIRSMLDETARVRGRKTPYKVSLTAFSLEKDNRKFGLDVERWVREGLVDGDVSPTSFSEGIPFAPPDVAYYVRITKGSGVGVYPMFNAWRAGEPQTFLKKLLAAYDAGATGIALWDPDTLNSWGNRTLGALPGQAFNVYRFVGHRDFLRQWASNGVPAPRAIPLKRYGENFYSRWLPETD